jgi:hypothetical protein
VSAPAHGPRETWDRRHLTARCGRYNIRADKSREKFRYKLLGTEDSVDEGGEALGWCGSEGGLVFSPWCPHRDVMQPAAGKRRERHGDGSIGRRSHGGGFGPGPGERCTEWGGGVFPLSASLSTTNTVMATQLAVMRWENQRELIDGFDAKRSVPGRTIPRDETGTIDPRLRLVSARLPLTRFGLGASTGETEYIGARRRCFRDKV